MENMILTHINHSSNYSTKPNKHNGTRNTPFPAIT